MMKTGKNNRFLASILAASMLLAMSPFAFAADTAEQKEMTTQEQVQPANPNETNANPTVSQMDDQSSEDTNSEALKTESQSPKDTNSEGGQPSKDVNPAGKDTTAGGSTSASKTPAESETPTEPETPAEPEAPKSAAKIGEKAYPTVADAIADAQQDDTIVLLRDVTENITINKSLTLNLGGFTLSGDGTKTVVSISGKDKDMDVTVKDGTVTGGHATYGGGFYIQSGNIKIENCIIEKNTAIAGGGVNIGGSANVKITGSEIRNNTVSGASGGAIYLASGWAYDGYYNCVCEVVDTKLNGNSAVIGGAVGMGATLFHDGIDNAYGGKGVTATFIMDGESIIDGNTAKYGGAVHLTGNGSRFLMKNGTITNNTATSREGGAIWATNYGGVTIEKGTISGNTAKTDGGAIYMKANIGETNSSAKLAIETGVRDVLNLGEVLITDNSAKQGGGIYIDSYASAYGIKADLKQASIYNNHASVRADDIYSTGVGTEGCTVQLGETADSWKLDCGDTVDNWYIDSDKMGEGTARWNAHPGNGDAYVIPYTQRENLKGVLTLKAAHPLMYTLTYDVTGDLPEGYTAPAKQTLVNGSSYTVAEVPASVSGSKDGVNGTFTFVGWKDKDGNVLTGEQQLTADITLHGVWTFTKKSSGGGGGGHKPTVTIPDDVPTGLNGDDHFAYIVGYPNGNVEPNGNITRAEVATIFFRLLTEEVRTANSTQSNSLSDVTRGQWFNHAVSTLSSMGIVKGHNDGTFAPNAPITRAEFAAIAARFDDKNTDTSSKFTDIASHWAKNEIGIAANKGWINGYPDGTFRPNQYITRAEAMTLINRVLNRLPENSSDLLDSMIKWPDNSDASAWYYLAVQEATNSHAYSDKSKDDKYEKWTTIRDARDWTELEK